MVSIEPAERDRDLRPLARRYLGAERGDRYADKSPGDDGVLVRMRPGRWLTTASSRPADVPGADVAARRGEDAMRHPRMVVTFSDSGAHVSQIMDASLLTHLLSHWVRAKQAFTLEQAVRMLSFDRGFTDRGLIREDMVADLVVFDPDTVAPQVPEVVHDRPAGASGASCSGRVASPRP